MKRSYKTLCIMDKREEKTLRLINDAFTKLINIKNYDDITIQDILEQAGISRSAFYAHFKTKNDLLLSISKHIFEHVFSKSLQEEKTHDFSKDAFFDYKHLIIHIFYHVQDEKELFKGILSSNGNEVFINEFKIHINKLVSSYFNNYPYRDESLIPLELKKEILVNDFIVILNYWVNDNFKETPENMGEYYFHLFTR